MNILYADCRWSIIDIIRLRPDLTAEQAHKFLRKHESKLCEAMVRAGWYYLKDELHAKLRDYDGEYLDPDE